MNIIILGAGAMGSLFGGYLSRKNNVLLLDVSHNIVQKINNDGLLITESDGSVSTYRVRAATHVDNNSFPKPDLVIIFVKAMFSRDAINSIAPIITADTFLMSLQNGMGHEELMLDVVDEDHVLIGTTQHNCAVNSPGNVKHGGSGMTYIGCLSGKTNTLTPLIENFNTCGISTGISKNYKRLVWEKLFTNVSASALTGVLQVPLGFIVQNKYAWDICCELIREAVMVAESDGIKFDVGEEIEKIRRVCTNSPEGITSICADLSQGRMTEVDTISGGVVRAAKRFGYRVPYHEMLVQLVHSFEGKTHNKN